MEPTKDELVKVDEFKEALKEHAFNNTSFSDPVRQAVARYAKDQLMLLKFIRGRKQNIQKAVSSIVRYAEIRNEVYPELFPEVVPEYVRHIISNRIISVLANKDTLGRTVVLFSTVNWDPEAVTLEEIQCAGRYLVEALMDLPEFLTKGGVLLCDCNGATINHVKYYTIPAIVKFVNVFWQSYPIPIKGLYYVNVPFFVRPVYGVIKPFLPSKLRERVLITSGVNQLHKRISPDILPESLGGVLGEQEAMMSSSLLQLPENNSQTL